MPARYGFGDAEDWAVVRVAELAAAGERAKVGFIHEHLGFHPTGPFHNLGPIKVVVVRADGTIERPPQPSDRDDRPNE